jgi:hypothetical protein
MQVGRPPLDDDLEELVDRELAPRRSRLGLVALGVGGHHRESLHRFHGRAIGTT